MIHYKDYIKKVTPVNGVFSNERKNKGITNNIVKWLALRMSYLLYRLGFSANFLDILGFVIGFIGYYYFYLGLKLGDINIALSGMLLSFFHTWIDYLDGALAKAKGSKSPIGGPLDNIGPDLGKYSLFIIIGMLTDKPIFILLNTFSSIILIRLFYETINLVPDYFPLNWIKYILGNKRFILGARFILLALPLILFFCLLFNYSIEDFSIIISIFYFIISTIWLLVCIPTYNGHKKG